MTGRYAHNHGVKRNDARDVARLDHETTLQHHLQGMGYHTGIFGKFLNKWHNDPPYFDRWSIFRGKHNYYGGQWNVNGQRLEIPGYRTETLKEHIDRFITDAEETDDDPWFLYVAVEAPHARYIPEARYRRSPVPDWPGNPALRERDRSDKPSYVQTASLNPDRARTIRRRQLRTLRSVDDLVDGLFRRMASLEERRNTVAVYMTDNGYSWGEHGLAGAVTGKGNPYTRSIRIPLLFRWPRTIHRGKVDERWVSNLNIAPTLLDAANVEPNSGPPMDGASLLEHWNKRSVFLEHWRNALEERSVPSWRSIRTPRYQYTEYTEGGNLRFREYYDLTQDRWQLHNLLDDGKKRNNPNVARLHHRLKQLADCRGATCS
jgi:arylsulfatase A-like enzyme